MPLSFSPFIREPTNPSLTPTRALSVIGTDPMVKQSWQSQLKNVLYALASRFSKIRYCQGMDCVVAFALRTLNAMAGTDCNNRDIGAKKTFYFMEMLLSQYTIDDEKNPYDLRGLFSPGLRRLRICCFQLEVLLSSRLPRVVAMMRRECIDVDMFCIG